MTKAFPTNPGGHLHTALWLVASQRALEAQGLVAAQGFKQRRLTQESVIGHSSSDLHPGSSAAGAEQTNNLLILVQQLPTQHANHAVFYTLYSNYILYFLTINELIIGWLVIYFLGFPNFGY